MARRRRQTRQTTRRRPLEGLRCACGRTFRFTLPDADGWNCELRAGVIVAILCPDCQTPEANAEAELHRAVLDYGMDADGRIVATPKAL